jgi:[ribosomal protein S5]-alanine N-acetyltransferase
MWMERASQAYTISLAVGIVIKTERLDLVQLSREETLARMAAMSPEDRKQLSPTWLALIENSEASELWIDGFKMVERASGTTVGSCGFKCPPDSDGAVEIAYGLAPEFQGKGFATEAAAALANFAFSHDQVRLVRAHTLPEVNASGKVLTRCGFRRVGDYMDPDDGLVWRWERSRERTTPAQSQSTATPPRKSQ